MKVTICRDANLLDVLYYYYIFWWVALLTIMRLLLRNMIFSICCIQYKHQALPWQGLSMRHNSLCSVSALNPKPAWKAYACCACLTFSFLTLTNSFRIKKGQFSKCVLPVGVYIQTIGLSVCLMHDYFPQWTHMCLKLGYNWEKSFYLEAAQLTEIDDFASSNWAAPKNITYNLMANCKQETRTNNNCS